MGQWEFKETTLPLSLDPTCLERVGEDSAKPQQDNGGGTCPPSVIFRPDRGGAALKTGWVKSFLRF